MISQPITVVLPMHNAEHHIERSIREVLDLAHSFVGDFSLVVVDNGSTDDTFETACELERIYPQIKVLREPFQQGLRRVMEVVKNCCPGETVLCHDGLTEINVDQLRSMLLTAADQGRTGQRDEVTEPNAESTLGSRRLGSMRSLQESMERVHGALTGFTWMKVGEPLMPRRCFDSTPTTVVRAVSDMPMSPAGSPQ